MDSFKQDIWWEGASCPYHSRNYWGRVRELLKRTTITETQDVWDAWRWFQDERHLDISQTKPWQGEFDDRLAFAWLVGCLMTEITWFIVRNREAFLDEPFTSGIIERQFHQLAASVSDSSPHITDLNVTARFRDLLTIFFNIILFEWNKYIRIKIKEWKVDQKIIAWLHFKDQLNDSPIIQRDLNIFSGLLDNAVEKARNHFGHAIGMAWWFSSLAYEFTGTLHQYIYFALSQGNQVSNCELQEYMPKIQFLLLERLREFTPFAGMATHVANFYQRTEGILPYEQLPSWHVIFSVKVFEELERNFAKIYLQLTDPANKTPLKEAGTMTCPVKMSVINGENVISILCREIIIPLFEKYYFPWRKENIPWA